MLVVWWATRVECASAIARLLREGALSVQEVNRARVSLAELYGSLREVEPSDAVREAAERILSVHPLRAADALQLAAALHWCDDDPAGRQFACLDRRLREAAESEGFSIVP